MSTNKCPHCGTTLFGMVSACFKCGGKVDFYSEIGKQRDAARLETRRQKALDTELREKFSTLFQALQANKACVYKFGTADSVMILRGDGAWEVFVADMLEHNDFTCFSCRCCAYLHVAPYHGASDSTSVTTWNGSGHSTLYFLRRRVGRDSPNNWWVDFVCQGCGSPNNDVSTTVSQDYICGRVMKGNPFVNIPVKQSFLTMIRHLTRRWGNK